MPEGEDPDDFITKYGRKEFLELLKEKLIIQSFIWNYNLSKINLSNPFEISNFEKEIKKLTYSIQDETLKKYVLEDFLEKLKNLTPLQSSSQKFVYSKFTKKKISKYLMKQKFYIKKEKIFQKFKF